jgi:hypothetical protein
MRSRWADQQTPQAVRRILAERGGRLAHPAARGLSQPPQGPTSSALWRVAAGCRACAASRHCPDRRSAEHTVRGLAEGSTHSASGADVQLLPSGSRMVMLRRLEDCGRDPSALLRPMTAFCRRPRPNSRFAARGATLLRLLVLLRIARARSGERAEPTDVPERVHPRPSRTDHH